MKRKTLLILGILVSVLAIETLGLRSSDGGKSDELAWEHDLNKAVARAKAEGKLVLMDIYADWCGPCRMMDANTYASAKVQKKLSDYVLLKVNSDINQGVAAKYGTGSLPTTVILGTEGGALLTQAGYLAPKDFMAMLENVETRVENLERLSKEVEVTEDGLPSVMELVDGLLWQQKSADALIWLKRIEPILENAKSQDGHGRRPVFLHKIAYVSLLNGRHEESIAYLKEFQEEYETHELAGSVSDLKSRAMLIHAEHLMEKENYGEAKRLFAEVAGNEEYSDWAQYAAARVELLEVLGKPAPEIEVDGWIAGDSLNLSELKGKVVLLDMFQIICPGCEAAHPKIESLRERYADDGLEVVGLAVAFEYESAQTPEKIKDYVTKKEFPFPTAIDHDLTATFRKFKAGGTPWTVLIDRNGTVRYASFFQEEEVEEKIKALLKEPAKLPKRRLAS